MVRANLISTQFSSISIYPIFEKSILSLLKKMRKGSLKLIYPDGKEIQFGKKSDPHQAIIRINDLKLFQEVLLRGDIGFGEAYVDGLWDTPSITNVISWFIKNLDQSVSMSGSQGKSLIPVNLLEQFNRIKHRFRDNSIWGSRKNIEDHYDLSNEFFQQFLDPSMTYSCGIFENQKTSLQEAQYAKYKSLANLVKIKKSDHVLEIGSGWGGFSLYLAKKYKCKITTITISEQQFSYAQKIFKKEKVDHLIEIRLLDYRKLEGKFDKIVSIEMLEAVGDKYFKYYFEKCNQVLRENGLIGLQVITCPHERYSQLRDGVDWIQKHIFPGSLLPSVQTLSQHLYEQGGFELYSLQDYGAHYAKTLKTWRNNFNKNLVYIKKLDFDQSFIRKWNYYFSYCEAAFQEKNISVVQLLYSKPNNIDLH